MWQGKAASKLHTHKRVDRAGGGYPNLSFLLSFLFLCWRRACYPDAGTAGEGRGGSGDVHQWGVCVSKNTRKTKGKPNSLVIPQQRVLVWKPAEAGLGEATVPAHPCVGHSSMASSLLGKGGRDHASPQPPARGRVLRTVPAELRAVEASLGLPGSTTTRGPECIHLRCGEGGGEAGVQAHLP